MSTAKKLKHILRSPGGHWVGDGFPVQTLFAYPNLGTQLSPFLMLDYGGPFEFPATSKRLGVGEHPHRGFETVTIVYHGEVEHRDSAGGGGKIGPGDVQWMTAASGLVHEEFHGREYAAKGGPFEMVQLWVNLPAEHKMSAPRYQAILNVQIPQIVIADQHGKLRVIAGQYQNRQGPAKTFTDLNVWDITLNTDKGFDLSVPDGHNCMLVVLKGELELIDGNRIKSAQVGLFDRAGESIKLESAKEVSALLLSGEPINEPIVGHGPFVMNTPDEIRQAISDYQNGKMGRLAAKT